MYSSYHTEAFIIKSYSSGEANKSFLLYTKRFGLILAFAQGIRFLKSKLRFNLQEYSYCEVSLVRGKEIWRLTGVKEIGNIYTELSNRREVFLVFARVFSLLNRLLHGEEKNERLFENIIYARNFILNNNLEKEDLRSFEYILAMRILKSLGYLGKSSIFEDFVVSPYWDMELISKMRAVKSHALVKIRESLNETQL